MPAMDLALIDKLGRDLHSHSPGYLGEDEVCPWTLFLTMALTLLKGIKLALIRLDFFCQNKFSICSCITFLSFLKKNSLDFVYIVFK